jgi:hypothetical protein
MPSALDRCHDPVTGCVAKSKPLWPIDATSSHSCSKDSTLVPPPSAAN